VQLPRVNFGPVQNEVAPATQRVASAVGGLSDTIRQGLTVYGQELVKSQAQEAQLALTKRLDEREQELRTRKAIPVAELKERLGPRFDKLATEVREQPLVKVRDEQTGEIVERPADVPTWAIAGDLFDHEVEQALGESEKHITVGKGWQSAFRGAALGDVLARKGRLNAVQLQAMGEYQADVRIRQALEFANAGNFDEAFGVVNGSVAVLGTGGQEKLRQRVTAIQQTKPIYDALRMVQLPAYQEEGLRQLDAALAALGDPKKFSAVDPDKLAGLTHEVRVAQQAVRDMQAKRDAATRAFEYAGQAQDERNPLRINEARATSLLEADVKAGKLSPEASLETRRLLQEHIRDRNDAAKQQLGKVAGDAMSQFMAIGPDGRPRMSFSNLLPETLRELRTYGEEGEQVIAQLIRWDQANETHERQKRQMPSAAEDARALAFERAIRREPETFRKMPTADLLAILTGNAPIPGEADAPAVAVSSRDLPHLRDMLGANAAEPQGVQVTSPGTIAQQEFERAFGLEKIPSKKWTPTQRQGLTQVTDEVARWVNGERAAGRPVTDDLIRDHLTGEDGMLHRLDRKSFLFVPYGPRTPLEDRLDRGEPPARETAPVAPRAAPAPAGAAPRARAANVSQVPLQLRQRIIDDFREAYPGRNPSAADIVRGYNAGLAAGEF
jgi:hypothetical protein